MARRKSTTRNRRSYRRKYRRSKYSSTKRRYKKTHKRRYKQKGGNNGVWQVGLINPLRSVIDTGIQGYNTYNGYDQIPSSNVTKYQYHKRA